ncbi:MAG: DUF4251 domain-containing protein [Prevotella sp.]|nr:DUF4251 domain-containing protein [Prevotella sp.]
MAFFVLLTGCSTSQATQAEKAERRIRVAQAVADSLRQQTFTIEVSYVNPQRMRSRNLSYGYDLQVRNGEVIESNLPFFGEVRRAEYGSQSGLNFTDKIAQYQSGRLKKDGYFVELVVQRRLEVLFYRIEVFDNGRASVMVNSDNRDSMHFMGEMIVGD